MTGKRVAKREQLLAHAAGLINQRGVGRVLIADLADGIGMARKSIYYYVADHDDLIFQCYQRACFAMAEDLAAACDQADDPAARLAAFIRANMAFDAPVQVAIADVDFLCDRKRAIVHDQVARLVDMLQSIIAAGRDEGRLRTSDPRLAADLVLGILNWTKLSGDWLRAPDTAELRQRSMGAIVDLVLHGVSADPNRAIGPFGIVGAEWRTDGDGGAGAAFGVWADQIIATASRLFNQRGIDATAMDDIVAALGLSKGAIYYYFPSKEELVIACYKRAFAMHHRFLEAAPPGSDGLRRLSTAIHLHAQAQMGALTPLIGQPGWASLPSDEQEEIGWLIRRVVTTGRGIYQQGAYDGSIRPLDSFYTGSAVAGAMLWISKWVTPGSADEGIAVADEITRLLMHGIAARDPAR